MRLHSQRTLLNIRCLIFFFPQEPTCLIPAMHVKAWDGSNGTNVKNGFYGQDTEAVAVQDANQSPYGFETMNVTVQVG